MQLNHKEHANCTAGMLTFVHLVPCVDAPYKQNKDPWKHIWQKILVAKNICNFLGRGLCSLSLNNAAGYIADTLEQLLRPLPIAL